MQNPSGRKNEFAEDAHFWPERDRIKIDKNIRLIVRLADQLAEKDRIIANLEQKIKNLESKVGQMIFEEYGIPYKSK